MLNASAKREESRRLYSQLPVLQARQRLNQALRAFFQAQDFLEIDTPLRIRAPALEDYIDAVPSDQWYLRTSPELHMKRLLAAGYTRIFQLGPCFRKNEYGRLHLPEFTMLEWYRTGCDYQAIFQDTQNLLRAIATALNGKLQFDWGPFSGLDLDGAWTCMTVDEAFARFAHAEVDELVAQGQYEEVLVNQVEPQLGYPQPVALFDFPAALGSLARSKPGQPERVERWELYIAGVEIANAYTELTDYHEQKRRFAISAAKRRAEDRDVYPEDREYLDLLRCGDFPECAGIALGIDRLLMLLTNTPCLDQVVPFPPHCN